LIKAPDRTQPATIEVLEHREGPPAQPLAQTDLAIECKGELLGDGHVLLVLVVVARVSRVSDHAQFGVEALVAPAVGCQGAVAIIARPTQGQGRSPAGVTIGLGVGQVGSGDVGTRLDVVCSAFMPTKTRSVSLNGIPKRKPAPVVSRR